MHIDMPVFVFTSFGVDSGLHGQNLVKNKPKIANLAPQNPKITNFVPFILCLDTSNDYLGSYMVKNDKPLCVFGLFWGLWWSPEP